jgi:hypothetical protein
MARRTLFYTAGKNIKPPTENTGSNTRVTVLSPYSTTPTIQ